MTPNVPSVLTELSQLLMRNAAPDVPPAERASALGLSAMLLNLAAEVWDGAAHDLVEENRAFRALLAEHGADTDLRLSALQAENARLRARIVEVQTAAEQAGDAGLQDRIWDALRASTERRKLSISVV
jgi:hypothetical protein